MSLWRRVLTERRVVVVPLLTALVINALVSALALLPLSRSVAGDETRAGDVKLALAEAQRMARVAGDTRTSQTRAGEELGKFYADVLPATLADARSALYLELLRLAGETGVQHESSIFEPEPVEDSTLQRIRTDVSLTGEYQGIRRFLYLLETSEEFLIVESVKLGSSGQMQGRGGSIEVVLSVATYYNGAGSAGAAQ